MPSSSQNERLIAKLRSGVASSVELEQESGLSQSSVSRALRALIGDGQVLRIGSARTVRYALRRNIQDIGSQWPLRRIDRSGNASEVGTLHALAADQYFLEPHPSAAGFSGTGLSNGLPYFLQDQRPGGFLGRAVPSKYPELQLPQRTQDWTDDHYLRYLTQRGSDTVGDLILGAVAFDRFLAGTEIPPSLQSSQRIQHYPQLADEVMRGGLPGSSAHGEHPKFAAVVLQADEARPVLVKFSPPANTAIGQRWADLLIAEHHAHRALRDAGIAACASEIFQIGGRAYLEVDRFDRAGARGRIGVTSLWAIDTAHYGQLDNWSAAAQRLHKDRRIDADTLQRIGLVALFGSLIANTDRHFGNLAFYDRYDGRFELAPIYDMLPMLFAPEHDQLMPRLFEPQRLNSDTLESWPRAHAMAQRYWETLMDDRRISDDFKEISARCLTRLQAISKT